MNLQISIFFLKILYTCEDKPKQNLLLIIMVCFINQKFVEAKDIYTPPYICQLLSRYIYLSFKEIKDHSYTNR